jgi:hypothetical protein
MAVLKTAERIASEGVRDVIVLQRVTVNVRPAIATGGECLHPHSKAIRMLDVNFHPSGGTKSNKRQQSTCAQGGCAV